MKSTFADPVRIPFPRRTALRQEQPFGLGTVTLGDRAALAARHPITPGAYRDLDGYQIEVDTAPLSAQQIVSLIASDNAAHRRAGFNALSDQMRIYTDLITGSSTVTNLSASGLLPDVTDFRLPTAVMLGDADRQMIDTRWAALFDVQDRRAEPWPGWFKVGNEYHNVSRRRYRVGERARLGMAEQDEAKYEHYLYGIGLQWNQLLMQGRWERSRGMTAMQIRWANDQAQLAYETLIAAGFLTQAYLDDDSTGAQSTQNDVATLNASMLALRTALWTATAPVGGQTLEEIIPPGVPYYLLYNENTAGYEDRVQAMLNVRYTVVQSGGTGGVNIKEVNRPVIPIGSPYVTTGHFYVVLPGRKNVFSVFRGLQFFDFEDVQVAGVAEGEVGWGADRFLRADANQVVQMALA